MILVIIKYLFNVFTILIFAKIIASWIPQLAQSRLMHFVNTLTDPYLNLFRRFIPPIGGTLDISPIVAIFALKFVEYLIFRVIFS